MSRKGNRGQASRQHTPAHRPVAPIIYDCPKHGIQRTVGCKYKDRAICIECMMDLFERECGVMSKLGDKTA